MAIATALSFSTTLDLSLSTKVFKLSDTTNYAGEGIALSDVVGIFKIVDPTGAVVHENTNFASPDIDADSSLDFNTVEVPVDINREVLKGNYTITYTIRVSGATDPGDYEVENTYTYNLDVPCLEIDLSYNCEDATITMVDATNYGDYVTTVSRSGTLTPPVGSGLSPTTGSTKLVTASPIATKTWTATLESTFTVTLDSLSVTYLLDGTKEITVDCATGSENLYNCIKALSDRYDAVKCTNPTYAAEIKDELDSAILNYNLYKAAVSAGELEEAAVFKNNVITCADNCGCSTDCSTSCDSTVSEVINPGNVVTVVGPQGPKGDTGATGSTGATGAAGADGEYGGFSSDWLFDPSNATGPSSRKFRSDRSISTTPTLIGGFYINYENNDVINMSSFLASFDNSGSYGRIKLFKEDDHTKFWMGEVTSVTDNGADYTIGVSYILHNGSFSDGDAVVISFTPAGADAAGTDGTVALYNSDATVLSTGAAMTTVDTYSLTANTLSTNGDALRITYVGRFNYLPTTSVGTMLNFNGNTITADFTIFETFSGDVEQLVEVIITRVSNTDISSVVKVYNLLTSGNVTSTRVSHTQSVSVGTINLTTTAYNIDARVKSDGTNPYQINKFMIELLKKS